MTRRTGLALLLLLAGCGGDGPIRAADVGSPAPEFASTTLVGDSVSLQDLRGRVVLLNVWATWCAPCREEIPALEAIHRAHAARGLEVIGVSIDAAGDGPAIGAFMREMGATYPVWHDRENAVSPTFRLIGVPSTFLIDREGTLAWKHVGPVTEGDTALIAALDRTLGPS